MTIAEIFLSSKTAIGQTIWRPIINLFWLFFWRKEELIESLATGQNVTSLRYSERGTLIRLVTEEYPFNSLLEAGCGVGQNISLISKLIPSIRLTGVDLSSKSLVEAQKTLQNSKCKSISLVESDLISLSQFADKSFEIVMASAVLLYIPGDEIEKVISELLRVTSKKLFLLEQHQENPAFLNQHQGVFVPRPGQMSGYWLRDYKKLLEKFVESEKIEIVDVKKPKWTGEKWPQYAKVIVTDVS